MFLDESGFLLIPNVRRTWGPVGKTPVLRYSYRHDRISVIGGLTMSPRGKRFGLYTWFHERNITGVEVADFLRDLLRHLRGHVFLVWDGGSIHKGKEVKTFMASHRRLHVHRFPAYAPELNPIELVWTHGKRDLSNSCHERLEDLGEHLGSSLRRVRGSQQLLRSCVEHTGL